MSIFDLLVWTGAGVSVLGLLGLIWCIIRVRRAKRAGQDDAAMRATLKGVMPLNLAALFLSVIGLMMVIFGVSLS
ncbi:MAG: hypothetical protein WBB25_12550 [Sulfitobacter sp.]